MLHPLLSTSLQLCSKLPRDWWSLLSEKCDSAVEFSFLRFFSHSQENWWSSSFSFPRGISTSLVCRACILTRIYPFSRSLRSASICLVTTSPTPFWLKLLYRTLVLCLNGYFLIVLARGSSLLPPHTWCLQTPRIWKSIPLPSRLFLHMVSLTRWQQSCPLRQL